MTNADTSTETITEGPMYDFAIGMVEAFKKHTGRSVDQFDITLSHLLHDDGLTFTPPTIEVVIKLLVK